MVQPALVAAPWDEAREAVLPAFATGAKFRPMLGGIRHSLVVVFFFFPGFCPVVALVARVIACFFFFVCLKFQIFRFVISTFTPLFFFGISFVFPPPPPQDGRPRDGGDIVGRVMSHLRLE